MLKLVLRQSLLQEFVKGLSQVLGHFNLYNDLPDVLIFIVKLLADGTSLFSGLHDISATAKQLNEDLNKINNCAFQWKMAFISDPSKALHIQQSTI